MPMFDLASILTDVSKMDTGIKPKGREQIEYIDIKLIDPDPNNFYALTGLEELAANIELLGLQQPLRVRPEEDKPGRYMIVSGHRRRAALELLTDEGKEQYAQVPCILEAPTDSAALQELRLIYANSDTRRLSSAEISKQAERVEALLYQLKAEGMEFPGRMRDHVAEACKVSTAKLGRLKVIRDNLDNSLQKHYEKGDLTEAAAYALARQPAEIQRTVFDLKCTGENGCKYLREWEVEDVADAYKTITEQTCEKCESGKCEHSAAMLGKIYDSLYSYKPCKHNKCCGKCEKLASCKAACPKLADKIKTLKADKKEAARQAKLAEEAKERPAIEQITALWRRFGEARARAGKSVKEYHEALDLYYSKTDDQAFDDLENAREKITPATTLPYGYSPRLPDVQRYIQAADCLECSLDYLLCRTDVPEVNNSCAPTWHTETPSEAGNYVAKFDVEGTVLRGIYYYDSIDNLFRFSKNGPAIDQAQVLGWIRLPED